MYPTENQDWTDAYVALYGQSDIKDPRPVNTYSNKHTTMKSFLLALLVAPAAAFVASPAARTGNVVLLSAKTPSSSSDRGVDGDATPLPSTLVASSRPVFPQTAEIDGVLIRQH